MRTKFTILMMAIALVTNVMAEDKLWLDITFGEYPNSFADKGYNLSGIAPGQNITGGMADNTVLKFDEYEFNFATNLFREAAPFASQSEEYGDKEEFEYAIQLRNNNNPTYIEFPPLPNVGKVVLFAYSTHVDNNNDIVLQKETEEGEWEELDTQTAYNLKEDANKDKKVIFEYSTEEEVTLRVTHKKPSDRYLVRVFRIVVEKYGAGSSVQSPVYRKIDLSVTGKTLFLSESVSNAGLSIFDLAGKQVFGCKLNSNKVDLQNINAGVYIVKLITEQGALTQKVIIKE